MIRFIQRRLIIPRGDTGSLTVPTAAEGDAAVFSIFDPLTRKTVLEKIIPIESEGITISLIQEDTINLVPKKYLWDIKVYNEPEYDEDGKLIDGKEINSLYAGYSMPVCEIREVAKGG